MRAPPHPPDPALDGTRLPQSPGPASASSNATHRFASAGYFETYYLTPDCSGTEYPYFPAAPLGGLTREGVPVSDTLVFVPVAYAGNFLVSSDPSRVILGRHVAEAKALAQD